MQTRPTGERVIETEPATNGHGDLPDLAQDRIPTYREVGGLRGHQREELAEAQRVWHRLGLHLMRNERLAPPCAIGVTSAIHGEGKTTSSISLATALAIESAKPILVIEADLAHPSIAQDCRMPAAPGLTDYLRGDCPLEAILRPTALSNLSVILAGEGLKGPHGRDDEGMMVKLRRGSPEMLLRLMERFSYVLLDLPCLTGDVNAEEMTRPLNGTLLVVRAGVTPMEKVKEAGRLLGDSNLVGVIHLGPPSAIPQWLAQLIAE